MGMQRAFPRDLSLSAENQGLWLRYQVLLKDDEFADWGVVSRELVGWISDRGRRVGMIKLDEWYLDPLIACDRWFWEAADGHSAATADFGQALLSAWPIPRLAERGPVVELSRVWMHPDHAGRSLWAMAVRALIQRRYAKRFSVLLLNTWPADRLVEEAEQLDWRGFDKWDWTRTALGRLARRELGVRPLPRGCPEGDRWWQWRALQDGVPKPKRRRLTWI